MRRGQQGRVAVLLALCAMPSLATAVDAWTTATRAMRAGGARRRLHEDGDKKSLATPIVHLLGAVLQTDEIELVEDQELDKLREDNVDAASDYVPLDQDSYDVEVVPPQQQQEEESEEGAEEGQPAEDREAEKTELQQDLKVVQGDEQALQAELQTVESDLGEESDEELQAQGVVPDSQSPLDLHGGGDLLGVGGGPEDLPQVEQDGEGAQEVNGTLVGGDLQLVGDIGGVELDILEDSDAPELVQEVVDSSSSDTVQAASAETKKTMTAQDMFDGSQWTLPPPPPPPPWEYHYADSDGNYILDSDGNAVNAPAPPHHQYSRYAHSHSHHDKSPPPPSNPPLLRPPLAPRPPSHLLAKVNTGVPDNADGSKGTFDPNTDLRGEKNFDHGTADGSLAFLARKHHAPELIGMLAMAVLFAMAIGVTVSDKRRRRRHAEDEAMSRPIVYGRPSYGAFEQSRTDYVPEEAISLLA